VTEERDILPEVNEERVRLAFQQANQILLPADIQFSMRSCNPQRTAAPGGSAQVDDAGFLSLAREFPARNGVSMLVVHDFHDRDLGGSAVESIKACIIKKLASPTFGHVLAHEFGHLLNLPHVLARDDTDVDNYNLMYPGLRAGHRLTRDQIRRARQSPLATWLRSNASRNSQ
jgi:hypothetical protein